MRAGRFTLPRHADIWLPDYLRSLVRARREHARVQGVVDILFAIVDHFEPLHGAVPHSTGLRRVRAWRDRYPSAVAPFTDADGRHPRHTFFFPIEQYKAEYVDPLAELTGLGLAEVEIHLHHDGDSAAHLREELEGFTAILHERHGLLSKDLAGTIRYGFIHGNWALANSLPSGRWCGVDDELDVLRGTGCYADFTLPAAPSPAQTRTVNQIYYADTTRAGPRAHDRGTRSAAGRRPASTDLLLVQGPLVVTWRHARRGIVPRLETGTLDARNPPTAERFADWLSCGISVAGRPEWMFVKVHSHCAPEPNAEVLLGPATAEFHRDILGQFNDGVRSRVHYVTAREMANIVRAAEEGKTGNAGDYRDFGLPRPLAAQ
jgi:hypothetical protein